MQHDPSCIMHAGIHRSSECNCGARLDGGDAVLTERESCAHLADIQAGLEKLHFNEEGAQAAERIARAIRYRTALTENRN